VMFRDAHAPATQASASSVSALALAYSFMSSLATLMDCVPAIVAAVANGG
jgi:hypothetical protein